MSESRPFQYRTSQAYGWPFYMARKALRATARWAQRTADSLSMRERYPSPFFRKPLLPDNARLKDMHRGKRCFIIGNGPSINTQDLSTLQGEITFAMNGFLNHPLIEEIQPSYYCLADPCYFDRSASSREFLDRLVKTVTKSHLIVPCSGASQLIEERAVSADRVSSITFAGILCSSGLPRLDLTRPIPNISACAELAMLFALYAGCSPIYLMGLDHDWLAHRGSFTHFYPQKTLANHAVARGEMGEYPYGVMIESMLKLWRGYQAIREYARTTGQRIVNATQGGFLDVFDREKFEDVLKPSAKPSIAKAA